MVLLIHDGSMRACAQTAGNWSVTITYYADVCIMDYGLPRDTLSTVTHRRLDPTGKLPADATRTNFETAITTDSRDRNAVLLFAALLRSASPLPFPSPSLEREREREKPAQAGSLPTSINANCCSIDFSLFSSFRYNRITLDATETEKDDEIRVTR
jgi:hypothetical protein